MRILQLCKKFPYPLRDGEAIAVTHLSQALRDLGCEITLLSMNTTKHFTNPDELPEDFDHYFAIHWVPLDNTLNAKDAFLNLFSSDSYHVERFVSRRFEAKLIEIVTANDFDIIQLETLYLTPYVDVIKKFSKAQVVMRAHNIEHEIWERMSRNTQFLPKKWYLSHLTRKLKNYEIDHLNDYDFLLALSDRDLQEFKRLGYKNGAMAAPIGIDTSQYVRVEKLNEQRKNFSLCFIGSLDWMPNIEGLNWFLQNVWPKIHERFPSVTLHVAGRNTPIGYLNLDVPNVTVHGEVEDAMEFISSHTAMVVPLFSGSGMRVKILEGMALGKVVISTSLGMEGIPAEHARNILVADAPRQFIEAVAHLLESPAGIEGIGAEAESFVREQYSSKKQATRLFEVYQGLLTGEYSH